MEYSYRDELYHHGIKGQKWGVRRYQNEDGTLTSAGKERYWDNRSTGGNRGSFGGRANSAPGAKARSKKLKTAVKIGAAVAATALVAYGAYKLNSEINKNLTEKYIKLGGESLARSLELDKYGSDLMDLADRAKFFSDPDLSKAAQSFHLNSANNYRKAADEVRDRGISYIKKAQAGKYGAREKIDTAKYIVRGLRRR